MGREPERGVDSMEAIAMGAAYSKGPFIAKDVSGQICF